MSENKSGVEYDSPEEEPSEDASSAIGALAESGANSAFDLTNTNDESTISSAAIGAVLETPSGSTQDSLLSQLTEKLNETRDIPQGGDDDESEDADEEQSSQEEEEDDDEEDDDEDEEEPVLKYSKIEGAAADILEKDTASAIAVGPTYFAVGTHNGLVHLFTSRGALLKSYRPHSASITDISISNSPVPSTSSTSPAAAPEIITDTIATTSLDGQAILHALRTGSSTGHNFRRPLRSISLSPAYTTSPQKSYVTGGLAGELVLTSRAPTFTQSLGLPGIESMLTFGLVASPSNPADAEVGGAQTHKILHSGAGPIWKVRWRADYIAWAVDAGVRVYCVSRGEVIAFVERAKESPRGDLWPCELVWSATSNQSTAGEELLIGWTDLVKVVRVSTRIKKVKDGGPGNAPVAGGGAVGGVGLGALAPGTAAPVTETIVEVTKVLRLDCMVAGVAYWPFLQGLETAEKQSTTAGSSSVAAVPAPATTAPLSTTTSASTQKTVVKPLHQAKSSTTFLLLAYLPTKGMLSPESSAEAASQRRQPSYPPELRIVSGDGAEHSRDVLSLKGHERWGCGDYRIVQAPPPVPAAGPTPAPIKKKAAPPKEKDHGGWLVLSPKGVVHVRKRDRRDRVMWLVERERYEEALDEMEKMEIDGDFLKAPGPGSNDPETRVMSKEEIGMMYLDHLFKLKQYDKAAKLCPKVLGSNAKSWEDWIFQFAHVEELSVLVPYVPFKTPRLSKIAYGIILAYYLSHDTPALSRTIKEWPSEIYDIPSLINAIPQPPPTVILMECMADLYIKNRQPGKALPYFLRLRRPNVFQLIQDNNLFTDVQDQALLLVEFDQELMAQREHLQSTQPTQEPTSTSAKAAPASSPSAGAAGGVFSALRAGVSAAMPTKMLGGPAGKPLAASAASPQKSRPTLGNSSTTSYWTSGPDTDTPAARRKARGDAIPLLVQNSHSIPIRKVVSQLEGRPYYLYLYLDALFEKDPELSAEYLERQVELYAEYAPGRVIRLLQTAQNLQIDVRLEKIYKICEQKDMVPEMVWTRSRMGDNKGALYLIIDRLGDVNRAIDFAKERKDDELWEDFLRYSETRPTFIKGLLENVSTEIDPIRIIRRIRNGLEIPGLKESLIKILQDFNLQTSLMEGCGTVLNSDCTDFSAKLQRAQVGGFSGNAASPCPICQKPIQQAHQDLILVFLCGHMVHAHCTSGGDGLPMQLESSLVGTGLATGRDLGAKIAYAEMVKRRLDQGCPVHQRLEQGDSSTLAPPHLASHHSHARVHRA